MSADRIRTYVATADDGSQTLVEVYPDGRVTLAYRANYWDRWSPPVATEDLTWTS